MTTFRFFCVSLDTCVVLHPWLFVSFHLTNAWSIPLDQSFWWRDRLLAPMRRLCSKRSRVNRLRQSFFTRLIRLNILSNFAFVVGVISSNSIICNTFSRDFRSGKVNTRCQTSSYFMEQQPDIKVLTSNFSKSHSVAILSISQPLLDSKEEKCLDNASISFSP